MRNSNGQYGQPQVQLKKNFISQALVQYFGYLTFVIEPNRKKFHYVQQITLQFVTMENFNGHFGKLQV